MAIVEGFPGRFHRVRPHRRPRGHRWDKDFFFNWEYSTHSVLFKGQMGPGSSFKGLPFPRKPAWRRYKGGYLFRRPDHLNWLFLSPIWMTEASKTKVHHFTVYHHTSSSAWIAANEGQIRQSTIRSIAKTLMPCFDRPVRHRGVQSGALYFCFYC